MLMLADRSLVHVDPKVNARHPNLARVHLPQFGVDTAGLGF